MYNKNMTAKREKSYMRIYEKIRAQITDGSYTFGEKLPPKRVTALDEGASLVTVEHAYALLEEEGYLEARERSGYYVSFRKDITFAVPPTASVPPAPIAQALEAPATPRHILDPVQSFTHSVYDRAVRKVLLEHSVLLESRSDAFGILPLREAIASYLRRSRSMQVNASQIVVGSGAEYLYGKMVRIFGRETLIALEDPCYQQILQVYQAEGARTMQIPMAQDGLDSDALWRCGAKLLHVTPFRSYPSNVTASISKRREYIAWARQHGACIVEDDYDSEFSMLTKAEDTLFSLEPEDTVFYINTFSRTIAPSLRTGYMVLPASRTEAVREQIGFYNCSVPVLDQLILTELIENGSFERHINRVRRHRRKNTTE